MKVEKVSLEHLRNDPENARKHSKKNLDAIKGSLKAFGQQKPIVVDRDNVVIAGNGTLEAAKLLGWKTLNVVRTDLSGNDVAAFALADNRSAELAQWDMDVLPGVLESLEGVFDLGDIGFDKADMKKFCDIEVSANDPESKKEESKKIAECPNCGFNMRDIS